MYGLDFPGGILPDFLCWYISQKCGILYQNVVWFYMMCICTKTLVQSLSQSINCWAKEYTFAFPLCMSQLRQTTIHRKPAKVSVWRILSQRSLLVEVMSHKNKFNIKNMKTALLISLFVYEPINKNTKSKENQLKCLFNFSSPSTCSWHSKNANLI